MARRRTRLVLSIPWDDEINDHPSQWGYDVLLSPLPDEREVYVVDFEEIDEQGKPRPV